MAFNLVSVKDFIPRTVELFQKGEGRGYSLAALGKDCVAGLTVGVVALPLAMAMSIAIGGSPAQGLYTAIAAGFFASLAGGSRYQITGPTVSFLIVAFGVISRHGMAGLAVATVLAGLMLIAMGLTGMGRFIRFIPYPVTTGFTAGMSLLIFSTQVKDFLGLTLRQSSPEFISLWKSYFESAATIRPLTLAVGVGTVVVIVLIRKWTPRIPGAVAGVIAATLVCYFFSINTETIGSRFGGIPRALPVPVLPAFSWPLIRDLLRDSFTIALLAAIESLLSAVVADGMTGDRHNANMELAAQGLGNIASALFGGIPATGALARTATNIKSGAVSPVAGIIHSLTLLLFILLLAPLASAIPLVSLSAVLIVTSWDMSNFPRFVRILIKAPKSDAIVLLVTFTLTVMGDMTFAVEVGVMLAAVLFLRRMVEVAEIRPGQAGIGSEILYGRRAGDDPSKEPAAPERVIPEHGNDIEIYEITGPFFFGVADTLQRILRGVTKKPQAFILRMRDVPAVDSTGIAALESLLTQCRHGKIRLILCEVRPHPRQALKKAGFIDELGPDNITGSLTAAIKLARASGTAD